jgi:hypothetical protein
MIGWAIRDRVGISVVGVFADDNGSLYRPDRVPITVIFGERRSSERDANWGDS